MTFEQLRLKIKFLCYPKKETIFAFNEQDA